MTGSQSGSALLEELRARLKQISRSPNQYGYQPYAGVQEDFHKNQKRGRVLLGGNRVGKTVSGAMESVWHLTGTHPYRSTPEPPVYGRGVSVDIEQGLNKIMLPEIRRWLSPQYLINGSWEDSYSKQSRVLTLANGSKMDFLTGEMDADQHAGTSRDFCWWDEEPPEYIFNEDMLRLVDVNGVWWMTMTPLLGFTWVYRRFYAPAVEKGLDNPNFVVFVGSTENNPHISAEVLEIMTEGMAPEEKEARKYGKFVAATGLVYPSFNKYIHVIPPIDPREITQPVYVAMDHGMRHPTVFLYGYTDNEGRLIIFHEYVEADRTILQHSEAYKDYIARQKLTPKISYIIGDPSIQQRSAQTGESMRTLYAQNQVFIGLANNDLQAGLNKTRIYIDKMGLFITEDCPTLIDELMGYRWDDFATRKANAIKKIKDSPRKIRDDTCDTLRYMVMSRPDDEFEGYAGEVRAPFRPEGMEISHGYAPNASGAYSEAELDIPDESYVHHILGDDW